MAALAVGTLAIGGLVARDTQAQVPARPGRPNVLFIAVDDLKPTLGAFGDEHAITPHLDRLAARGTVFRNAHCAQAVCAPSRASVLTGLRPDQTRVWDLQTRFRDHNPNVITLPQHFKNNGYETVGIGKIYDARSVDSAQTMDEASWTRPYLRGENPQMAAMGYADPQAVELIQRQLAEGRAKGLPEGRELRLYVTHRPPYESADVPDDAYRDGVNAREAAKVLAELAQGEKPFFFAVGFDRPHLPFNAPSKYWNLYDPDKLPVPATRRLPQGAPGWAFQDSNELRSSYTGVPPAGQPIPADLEKTLRHGYYAATSYVDAQIGIVLDALEQSGQLQNTIVVLWGDHGFHLGDHGMWCKHTNYEQATRSPLIIAAPAGVIAPSVTDAPVELLDLYATLCELASLERPAHVQGVSLVPAMRDPTVDVHRFAVSQYPRNARQGSMMGYALRDRRYRFVQWRRWDRDNGVGEVTAEEWYDLNADPDETHSVPDRISPDLADAFRAHVEAVIQVGASASPSTAPSH
ncbi:MAG TPA: sulfatase [Tepidisphaeraceae bacterium]|nr:sulfatase [Tepidisphaeraceae bacterium]